MEPMLSPETRQLMSDYLDGLVVLINERGHAVQFVDSGAEEPPLAYTVGLHVERGYELAISGLTYEASCSVLNSLVAWLGEQQSAPSPSLEIAGLAGNGYSLRLVEAGSLDPFVMARTLYGYNPLFGRLFGRTRRAGFRVTPGASSRRRVSTCSRGCLNLGFHIMYCC
ncbi:DUF4262 domain-containing protein [Streptomyces sp. IBSNAI002]|uniref:DUF4262 domain-containing protein n=1 Tax=Streptomyces sp. IBSNAI002 TaxID=3457500 RepID=UPI003FD27F86